jgi:hypothetical protein
MSNQYIRESKIGVSTFNMSNKTGSFAEESKVSTPY